MLKAVMILLALAAIRLLPKALRSEARAAELLALLWQVTLAATANTSKAMATEARVAAQEKKTGTITSQHGTVGGGFGGSIGNLSQTETGTVQYNGSDPAVTGLADVGVTSGPSAGAAHTHDFGGHRHPEGHFHFTQMATDYNNFAASYDQTLTTLNQIKTALTAAGIL